MIPMKITATISPNIWFPFQRVDGAYGNPMPAQGDSEAERKEPPPKGRLFERTGGDLLSQAVAHQVPSALRGLTALFGMGRGVSLSLSRHQKGRDAAAVKLENRTMQVENNPSSPRPISTGLLTTLLRLHSRPINLVVYQGPYSLKGMGELHISRTASRLDAFSGYPFRA